MKRYAIEYFHGLGFDWVLWVNFERIEFAQSKLMELRKLNPESKWRLVEIVETRKVLEETK